MDIIRPNEEAIFITNECENIGDNIFGPRNKFTKKRTEIELNMVIVKSEKNTSIEPMKMKLKMIMKI